MKKSYKGFMAWLVLFCVGVLAIIFMDIKNIDLVGLVLGNYMFITLAILTGMIYKNEAIYWYTGISYQEACAVTSKQRKEYACFWNWFRDAMNEMIDKNECNE